MLEKSTQGGNSKLSWQRIAKPIFCQIHQLVPRLTSLELNHPLSIKIPKNHQVMLGVNHGAQTPERLYAQQNGAVARVQRVDSELTWGPIRGNLQLCCAQAPVFGAIPK